MAATVRQMPCTPRRAPCGGSSRQFAKIRVESFRPSKPSRCRLAPSCPRLGDVREVAMVSPLGTPSWPPPPAAGPTQWERAASIRCPQQQTHMALWQLHSLPGRMEMRARHPLTRRARIRRQVQTLHPSAIPVTRNTKTSRRSFSWQI